MTEPAWEFEHSIECNASRLAAWSYWTNVANWDDPPAKFQLDGPFTVGSRLTTILPDQTWHSVIQDVNDECDATIEMQLPNAILSFHWRFEDLPQGRTRITQRLSLAGPSADAFLAEVQVFERSVPDGTKKGVAAIERAQAPHSIEELR